MAATERLTNAYTAGTNSSSNGGGGGDDKDAKKGKAGKKDKKQQGGGGGASSSFDNSDVVVPSLPAGIDWDSEGLISSLKLIFDAALKATFPQCKDCLLHHRILLLRILPSNVLFWYCLCVVHDYCSHPRIKLIN